MIVQLRGSDLAAFGRPDQIVQQLETAIGVGLLNEGDRLPPELALAAHLGVSPLTLRQSLALLRSKGLVGTRRGRGGGSYISGQIVTTESDIERLLRARSTDDLRDLGDLAASVAAATARLAALRSDKEDVRRVRELVGRFEAAANAEELRRADSRVHIGIAVASQSRRLTAATIQLHGEFAAFSWSARWEGHQARAATGHSCLISAIERRDAPEAQRIAVEHFEYEAALLIDQHLDLLTTSPEQE